MDSYLDTIFWQFLRFGLILLAALLGWWSGQRLRRRLARREPTPKWASAAAVGLGLAVFVVLAVGFGFLADLPGAS